MDQQLKEIKEWLQKYRSLPQSKKQNVQIIAASKTQKTENIMSLFEAGQVDFGENYVQEAMDKMNSLRNLNIRWHMIGHIQKNKAKELIGKFHLIHSVDSLELAQILSRKSVEANVKQKILLQINQGLEVTKTGFDIKELMAAWNEMIQLPNLQICGLMSLPPLGKTPEESRPYFKELVALMKDFKLRTPAQTHPMNELSMGTSHDYKVAVEEGATLIRIGTALFGERK